jgi:hypothetical protein
MSDEKVVLVRRMTEAFNRGDLNATLAPADPPLDRNGRCTCDAGSH